MGTQLPPKGHNPLFSTHIYCVQTVTHVSYCWALVRCCTLCINKRHTFGLLYNFDIRQPILIILSEILLRKCAIKRRFIFPPHLTSALLGRGWTSLRLQNKRLRHTCVICYRLPRPSWCRSLCQKWELFFLKPGVKSQWPVLVVYSTMPPVNVSYRQTPRRWHFVFLQHSASAHSVRNTVPV